VSEITVFDNDPLECNAVGPRTVIPASSVWMIRWMSASVSGSRLPVASSRTSIFGRQTIARISATTVVRVSATYYCFVACCPHLRHSVLKEYGYRSNQQDCGAEAQRETGTTRLTQLTFPSREVAPVRPDLTFEPELRTESLRR
jgi:hypothetical protein